MEYGVFKRYDLKVVTMITEENKSECLKVLDIDDLDKIVLIKETLHIESQQESFMMTTDDFDKLWSEVDGSEHCELDRKYGRENWDFEYISLLDNFYGVVFLSGRGISDCEGVCKVDNVKEA